MSSNFHSRGRPSNLTVSCNNCEDNLQYNPSTANQLCASCENLAAASMAPVDEQSDDEQYESAQEEIIEDEGEDDDDGSSVTELGPMGREFRGEDMDVDEEQTGEDMDVDGEDLFASTFGADAPKETGDEEEVAPSKPDFIPTEHTKFCPSSPGPPTPPPPQQQKSRSSSAQMAGPRPPNPQKDLSWNMRRLKRFYVRAKELTPHLPLAEHRYWIGVLNIGKNPDNFKAEKDFTWMKGSKKSTVETVWHMYQQRTAEEGFVILLGHERVDFKDCVEELDYFGEKKVIFRAVKEKHPDAKGKELSEGIVPKEIVPNAKVVQEVIILDDDE